LHAQCHDRGIDIARLADRRIDQYARRCEQLDRLFGQQPTRHVEIVNHHVAEHAARAANEFDRRRRRVVARDAQDLGPPDTAGPDLAFEPREIRVEAAVERDHQRHPALLRHRGAGSRAAAVEIERLLAEDRLAGTGRRFDQIGMGVGRAGDQDRIDTRVGQRFRLAAPNRTVPFRQPLRRCSVSVDDRVQSRLGVGSDIGSVDRADAPGTELAEANHAPRFRLFSV
jgi:hypothetical protein